VTTEASQVPYSAGASALKRELGRWDLAALGVNQVIGGAVFAAPAVLAASRAGFDADRALLC
jgi:hypothetical protein